MQVARGMERGLPARYYTQSCSHSINPKSKIQNNLQSLISFQKERNP